MPNSEKVLGKVKNTVKFKKEDGTFSLLTNRLTWHSSSGDAKTFQCVYSDIKGKKLFGTCRHASYCTPKFFWNAPKYLSIYLSISNFSTTLSFVTLYCMFLISKCVIKFPFRLLSETFANICNLRFLSNHWNLLCRKFLDIILFTNKFLQNFIMHLMLIFYFVYLCMHDMKLSERLSKVPQDE